MAHPENTQILTGQRARSAGAPIPRRCTDPRGW